MKAVWLEDFAVIEVDGVKTGEDVVLHTFIYKNTDGKVVTDLVYVVAISRGGKYPQYMLMSKLWRNEKFYESGPYDWKHVTSTIKSLAKKRGL